MLVKPSSCGCSFLLRVTARTAGAFATATCGQCQKWANGRGNSFERTLMEVGATLVSLRGSYLSKQSQQPAPTSMGLPPLPKISSSRFTTCGCGCFERLDNHIYFSSCDQVAKSSNKSSLVLHFNTKTAGVENTAPSFLKSLTAPFLTVR